MHTDPQTLQAYINQQLSSSKQEELARHLKQCTQCNATLAQLQEEEECLQQAFAVISPSEKEIPSANAALARFHTLQQNRSLAETNSAPSKKTSPSLLPKQSRFDLRQLLMWWVPAFSVATLALFVFWQAPSKNLGLLPTHPRPQDGLIMKNGDPVAIAMFAQKKQDPAATKRYNNTHVLQDGQRLSPGDLLQFIIRLPRTMHCLVLSINQKREVYVYLPLEQERSMQLPAGEHLYPNPSSMELDDTLGQERFFLFFSAKPLPVKQIKQQLQASILPKQSPRTLAPPKGPWQVQTFWIWKKR